MCTALPGMCTMAPAMATRSVPPINTRTPPRNIIDTCSAGWKCGLPRELGRTTTRVSTTLSPTQVCRMVPACVVRLGSETSSFGISFQSVTVGALPSWLATQS